MWWGVFGSQCFRGHRVAAAHIGRVVERNAIPLDPSMRLEAPLGVAKAQPQFAGHAAAQQECPEEEGTS